MNEHTVCKPIELHCVVPISNEKPDDVFICCASFEDRCMSSVLKLAPSYHSNYSVVFAIEEPSYDNQVAPHLQAVTTQLSPRTLERLFAVSCQRDSPLDGMTQFLTHWQYIAGCLDVKKSRVTLDISGFSKIYLLELLRYLIHEQGIPMPRVLHTTQRYTANKLTKGVEKIEMVPGYQGMPCPGKQTLLVLFLGFEPERALTVWEHFYPSGTIALMSDPPRDGIAKYLEYARRNNAYLLSRPSVSLQPVPPDSPLDTKRVLSEIAERYKETHNMIIGPFGTKPQTVGVFLFCMEHPGAQVVYSFPVDYTQSYLNRRAGATLLLPVGGCY